MRRLVGALMAGTLLIGCREEPAEESRDHVSYVWTDPAIVGKAPFVVYPGAEVLSDVTDLVRRARRTAVPNDTARVLAFETDAPVQTVVEYYRTRYEGAITRSTGDFAADERALAPILMKLSVSIEPGKVTGRFEAAVLAGSPSVSVQRPYRNFVSDRVVDRTLVLMID